MLLRIEDTDRERSTEAAIQAILDGLSWLGLSWDGDVVYQFLPDRPHREAAGACSPKGRPIAAMRARRSSRRCARPRAARASPCGTTAAGATGTCEALAGVKPVIRLKAPTEGETVVEDAVQGRVVAEQGSRRPRAASIRRHTDLHARGRGGRPRHGHHPRHPRRRPPHECGAADADLPGSRLGRAEHVAIPLIHGPDGAKLSKRHERSSRGLPVDGIPARGPAQLPRAWAGATGTRRSSRPTRWCRPSTSGRSGGRRPASISPSSRVPTGTTCASRPMSTSCGRWKRSCRNSGRRAPRRDVRAGPVGEAPCGHAGPQGAGEDARRAPRQRVLPLRSATAHPRRQGADAAGGG